jgi:hypothetical protein
MPIDVVIHPADEEQGPTAYETVRAACCIPIVDEWRLGDMDANRQVTLLSGFRCRVSTKSFPDVNSAYDTAIARLPQLSEDIATLHATKAIWQITVNMRLACGRPPNWDHLKPPRFPSRLRKIATELRVGLSLFASNNDWISHWHPSHLD